MRQKTDRAGTDARGLAAELRKVVRGEVRFDASSRALYSTDASNYRQVPIGVVVPRSVDDVVATVAACRAFGAPLLSRGGGTSLAGQACNVAVVIDWSKYVNQVLEIDPERRLARVRPGLVLDDLRNAAERHGLTFGPDPATHDRCTLGGMIGNNSCGPHSIMAGKTDDNVEELEVLTYRGDRFRVGATSDDDYARIQLGEAGAPRSTGGCSGSGTATLTRSGRAFPTFRGWSRGSGCSTCCQSGGSTWLGRWSGPSRPA